MSSKIPKAAQYRIEVATRKQMRDRQKDSAFMRKSLNIYNGQSKRASENQAELPYTIEEFRAWLRPFVGSLCTWCNKKITIKQLTVDHRFPISRDGSFAIENLEAICKPCNYRKGKLLPIEYAELIELLDTWTDDSKQDLFRRLTIGGKFSFKS